MEIYSITEKGIRQLYFQNPEFGFFLVKPITGRLIGGLEKAKKQNKASAG